MHSFLAVLIEILLYFSNINNILVREKMQILNVYSTAQKFEVRFRGRF